jgi:ribonuclease P protein component
MLKKENRLTKKKDFEKVFKNGKFLFSKIVGIKVLKNDLNINRYGILVGKKVSKKAVDRNLVKRRIREIIRKDCLNITNSKDIIILTLPLINNSNYDAIRKALFFCLKRVR